MKEKIDIAPKKILICQLRQIGDVLLATPSIRLLKKRYPNAQLHVVTEKKCLPVLENNPFTDKIWPIDRKALRNPITALAYYAKIGRNAYDIIVDFQQLPRCKWIVRFSKAPVKLTFTPPWYNKYLYTDWSIPREGYAAMCKAGVLSPLGIEWAGEAPEIWLTDEERKSAKDFLISNNLGSSPFITVDPSHRRETRRWPARHFSGLIQMLVKQRPDLKALILFGPGERELAEQVSQLAGKNAVVPQSMLGLREMAAVQERAALHLGNCSSPRHFAVAVDTPSVTIHGATGFGWRFPSDEHISLAKKLDCMRCNKNTCPTRECLEDYLPAEVFEKTTEVLEIGLKKRGWL